MSKYHGKKLYALKKVFYMQKSCQKLCCSKQMTLFNNSIDITHLIE